MKKLALAVMAITALVLSGVPASEVEARPPSCRYDAVVTATHVTCGITTHPTSGWTLAGCQAKAADLVDKLNGPLYPQYSNAFVSTQCYAVGDGCPQVQ